MLNRTRTSLCKWSFGDRRECMVELKMDHVIIPFHRHHFWSWKIRAETFAMFFLQHCFITQSITLRESKAKTQCGRYNCPNHRLQRPCWCVLHSRQRLRIMTFFEVKEEIDVCESILGFHHVHYFSADADQQWPADKKVECFIPPIGLLPINPREMEGLDVWAGIWMKSLESGARDNGHLLRERYHERKCSKKKLLLLLGKCPLVEICVFANQTYVSYAFLVRFSNFEKVL